MPNLREFYKPFLLAILFCFCIQFTFGQDLKLGALLGGDTSFSDAQFSKNGKYILIGDNGTAKLFETSSGRLIHTMEVSSSNSNVRWSWATTVGFSPNEKYIIAASGVGAPKVFNIDTGELIYEIGDPGSNLAKFSPDGKYVVTKVQHGEINMYEFPSGNFVQTLGDSGRISDFKFSRDGKTILVSSQGQLDLVKLSSGEVLASMLEESIEPQVIDLSNNGILVAAELDDAINIYNVESGELVHSFDDHDAPITALQFSPNSGYLITGFQNGKVKLYNTKSGLLVYSYDDHFNDHQSQINSIQFNPDGNLFVTASDDSSSKLVDVKSGKLVYSFDDHKTRVYNAQFSHNGKLILTASDDSSAKLYDITNGRLIKSLSSSLIPISSIKISPNDRQLVTSNSDGKALIVDISSGQILKVLDNSKNANGDAKYSLDGNYLVKIGQGGAVDVFDTGNWDLMYSIKNPKSQIKSIDINKRSSELLVLLWNDSLGTDEDGQIIVKIYALETGSLIKEFDLSSIYAASSSLSSDGQYIYVVCLNLALKKVDIKTGEIIDVLGTGGMELISAKMSPDDSYFSWNDLYENESKIFNSKSGEFTFALEGHTSWVSSTSFSHDSKYAVTSSYDKTSKVYDLGTGLLLKTLSGHNSQVTSADISSKNKFIATSSADGSYILFDFNSGEELIRQFVFDGKNSLWLLPNGYYFASKKAAATLYYIKGMQTIGFEQLDVKYNRPDKVLEVLGGVTGTKDTTMIKAYKKAWQKRIKKLAIDTTSFKQGFSIPESDFTNREAIAYEQNNSELELDIKAFDSTYLLERFNIWVNEVPVYGNNGISVKLRNIQALDTTLTIKLSNGINKIETSILNINGIESYRLPLYVNYTNKETIEEKLYFVGIGIDLYKEEGHNLNYSVKDIRDLSIQLKKKYGNHIEIDTLFNQNVTIKNIQELKDRLKQSKVDDKVIVSFSGHGLLSKDLDYYLATYDVNFNSPEQHGLPYGDLEYLLDGIPSRKKLLLIDACHSGEVDKDDVKAIAKYEDEKEGLKGSVVVTSKNSKMGMKNSFELMKELFNNIDRATGATIISAAAGTQFAQERGELKNGVFTYCILKQLKEKETITVSELKQLVSEQVKEITNGLQQPTSRNETIENDWKVW